MLRLQFTALMVAALVSGCATQGPSFDDAKARDFVMGQTTRDDAVAALGQPNLEVIREDGLTILRWERRSFGLAGPVRRVVSANFRDGRLVYLHAPETDEEVSVF